jgi:hypothetical protein
MGNASSQRGGAPTPLELLLRLTHRLEHQPNVTEAVSALTAAGVDPSAPPDTAYEWAAEQIHPREVAAYFRGFLAIPNQQNVPDALLKAVDVLLDSSLIINWPEKVALDAVLVAVDAGVDLHTPIDPNGSAVPAEEYDVQWRTYMDIINHLDNRTSRTTRKSQEVFGKLYFAKPKRHFNKKPVGMTRDRAARVLQSLPYVRGEPGTGKGSLLDRHYRRMRAAPPSVSSRYPQMQGTAEGPL